MANKPGQWTDLTPSCPSLSTFFCFVQIHVTYILIVSSCIGIQSNQSWFNWMAVIDIAELFSFHEWPTMRHKKQVVFFWTLWALQILFLRKAILMRQVVLLPHPIFHSCMFQMANGRSRCMWKYNVIFCFICIHLYKCKSANKRPQGRKCSLKTVFPWRYHSGNTQVVNRPLAS